MVYGVLAEEAVDKSGEIFDYETSKPLFQAWSSDFEKRTTEAGQEVSKGNLRAMHEGIAAGKFTQMVFDDAAKKIIVAAHVVDKAEWEKCEKGVYTGFSIGGKYEKQWMDEQLKKVRYTARPAEGSIVDNACMYGATFSAIKADGAEELRKFVGAPAQKDAAALASTADSVLEGLKNLLVQASMMEGDPSAWTIHDIAEAMSRVLSVKGEARYKIVVEMDDVAMGAPAGDLKKVDEAKPTDPTAPAADPVPDPAKPAGEKPSGEAPAADPVAVDPAKAASADTLSKLINESFQKSLESLTQTLTKHLDDQVKAVKDGIPETVSTTVGDAVKTAMTPIEKSMEEVKKDLELVKATPAAVGRPVHTAGKTIGSGPGGGGGSAPMEVVQKFLDEAQRSGKVDSQAMKQLRLQAATAAMP
ncbi:MAG TPA: hypothetical protein VGK94_07910 [Candidatus Polarisedimenticolia bacterium]|jgi:hypothetical protein